MLALFEGHKKMKSLEIRQRFFDFFTKRGHEKVASSSLIPAQDPTLLFANAGMNQFKDLFLGKEKRSYNKAVTIQKCVRAGGKHNDLDNVGFTKRHLTFFEMMGNFSFGDYFKREAITYAWDFLTSELGLPEKKLHVSVFTEDDEAYDIWNTEIGVPTTRIHRLGAKDNFWQMGETGPCGPCTEIYVDRGAELGCRQSSCSPGCDCDRFLEIWNLVFMQFDRQPDGSDVPLLHKGVDTGMGLERVSAVMQNKDSVYETDLFAPIIAETQRITGVVYAEQPADLKAAFHVLADHIRSSSMLISDGCSPSNEGRGYVLRKIIRRAALFAQKLSEDIHLFPNLSKAVVDELGSIYPELAQHQHLVYQVLLSEIEKFAANLTRGNHLLKKYITEHMTDKLIPGEEAFKMYDTYGFPIELVEIIAHEHGFEVDMDGFDLCMKKQKEHSGKKGTDELEYVEGLDPQIHSEFTGYQELSTTAPIKALVVEGKAVPKVAAGTRVFVIAERSPFFIVGGGQVPDEGSIVAHGVSTPLTHVRYIKGGIAAEIITPVALHIGDEVTSVVDKQKRIDAMKNHTATHLLQAALMEVCGKQIKQSGSLVHPDYLRFDFTYHTALSETQIKQVEDLVNEKIRENIAVDIRYMSYRDAVAKGALAFFGDKYNPEEVRVVDVPDFSTELCGGTHVARTGDIGTFKITQETSLSAGHRRIFALTGPKAIALFQQEDAIIKNLSTQFKIKPEAIVATIDTLQEKQKELLKELKNAQQQLIMHGLKQALDTKTVIKDIPFIYLETEHAAPETLKETLQKVAQQHEGFYVAINRSSDRTAFVAMVTPSFADRVNLADFGAWLKETHKLQGGGSKNYLQGAGPKIARDVRDSFEQWVRKAN
jgi:alanyl-tRNA synthetase